MSILRNTFIAAVLVFASAAPALADSGDPWQMANDKIFVVNPQGKMMSHNMSGLNMTKLMKGAHKVPKGTLFFMHDGELYMMTNPKAFDRGGAPYMS